MRETKSILLTACLVLAAAHAVAQTELEGTTAGGAFYRIAVPTNWTPENGLVIWNHGFDLDPPDANVDLGPLVDIQLSEGYAVAASSYRLNGWAVFKTNKDNKALVDVFRARVGNPSHVIVTGASLGGAVTAANLEKGKLGNVVGAFTFCGAMAGSRSWDGALDLRLIYDQVCQNVPESEIPGGATGLPEGSNLSQDEILERVNACTGVGEPRRQRSRTQKDNLERLLELTQLPEEFIETDMIFATQALADLIFDRGKLKGRQGVENAHVDYGDAEINENIERVEGKRKGLRRLAKNFTPKGKVGNAKIVSIHTDKDGLVIVENESEYASVVPEDKLTVGIVVEQEPSHCGFSVSEVLSGWESLRSWIAGGAQPTVDDLQTNCNALSGLFGGPCRFDPGFVIPDMDGRIRPRD